MRALFLVLLVVSVSCGAARAAEPAPFVVQAPAPVRVESAQGSLTLDVLELVCHTCASEIVMDARVIPGVSSVEASIATHLMVLRYDPAVTDEPRIIAAVEDIVDRVAR